VLCARTEPGIWSLGQAGSASWQQRSAPRGSPIALSEVVSGTQTSLVRPRIPPSGVPRSSHESNSPCPTTLPAGDHHIQQHSSACMLTHRLTQAWLCSQATSTTYYYTTYLLRYYILHTIYILHKTTYYFRLHRHLQCQGRGCRSCRAHSCRLGPRCGCQGPKNVWYLKYAKPRDSPQESEAATVAGSHQQVWASTGKQLAEFSFWKHLKWESEA